MRKLMLILGLVLSLISYGQTTQEEYDYVTKGYAAQVSAGLPDKTGYAWETGTEFSAGNKKIAFKKLYKVVSENEKTLKAVLMMYQKDETTKEYICVPHPNSEQAIRDLYWNVLYNNNTNDPYRMVIIAYNLPKMINWYY